MLHGRSLIYFGPGRWDGMWRNRHQLLSRFARQNRVLYVEPPHYFERLRRLFQKGDWRELRREARAKVLRQVNTGLYVYRSPITLPLLGRAPFEALTRDLWLRILQTQLRRLNLENPIVWLARPEWHWVLGHLSEALTIYHVVDEYSAYQDLTAATADEVRNLERRLLPRVDLVVLASPRLLAAKGSANAHSYLVPNAVDLDAFSAQSSQPPADIADCPKPRLIYAGLIGARLDLVLLKTVAQRRPEWSVLLLGEVNAVGAEEELAELRSLKNIHFLGVKPVAEVPGYLAACDVCLLPYRLNAESEYIDPLKLYEGLAAGKPVVITPIPAVSAFQDVVYVASNAVEIEQRVLTALDEDNPVARARRRARVAEHTWDKRVEQISTMIEDRLLAVGHLL